MRQWCTPLILNTPFDHTSVIPTERIDPIEAVGERRGNCYSPPFAWPISVVERTHIPRFPEIELRHSIEHPRTKANPYEWFTKKGKIRIFRGDPPLQLPLCPSGRGTHRNSNA